MVANLEKVVHKCNFLQQIVQYGHHWTLWVKLILCLNFANLLKFCCPFKTVKSPL